MGDPALVDTTVLSNFAHVGQSQRLRLAFDDLAVPRSVMDELAEGERSGRVPVSDWGWLRVVELTDQETRRAVDFKQRLGAGEADCLAIAESRGWMVLTDDRDARKIAAAAGVALSGTLGAQGVFTIPEADTVLADMKRRGYRCPIDSLRELEDD
jgi:predicted nucleic acid-binding protein